MTRWIKRYISLTLLLVVGFTVYILFFNENSYAQRAELDAEVQRLKNEIQANRDTMLYYQELQRKLDTDRETMEKIVREHYHMQRESEDVYVFDN
ncbi:MAG: septum formation initiator family protein [Muribaculaceae bacterium]|nr:septum formation initiator family protein [Muribaculaceae bacterium]